ADPLIFLSLRLPDRPFFEEAQSKFDIQGRRVRINELNLFGNAVSLRGRGEMNLDGTDINMDFNVDPARLSQVLAPGIRKIPQAISNQSWKINMRGEVGKEPKSTQEPMPCFIDRLKNLAGTASETPKRPAQAPTDRNR